MLEPSTNMTISRDEKEAGVYVGGEKVIKKLEVVKQENCRRIRRAHV